MNLIDRTFCIAPMLDKTDRHYRYIARLLTHHALLYTEMITTGAILKGDTFYQLRYDPAEHPVALQLGGSDPNDMRECARIAEDYGYDEININVGCPSDRVQNGIFGACLMAKPELVAECVQAMQEATKIPVTIKHRIGIDNQDSYEELAQFIQEVSGAGCKTFIIHARKAWLQGLSPKDNREIPPLSYGTVYQVKRDFPDLEIIINGGIKTIDECKEHLRYTDGVMIGREAYSNLYMLAQIDRQLYGNKTDVKSRKQVLVEAVSYIEAQLTDGTKPNHITRHLLGLFQGMNGARQWRRQLSDKQSFSISLFKELVHNMSDE